MLNKLIPDKFVLILIVTVTVATIFPAYGTFAEVVSHLATLALVSLFFFHGAKLERSEIVKGFLHWQVHLSVIATTFLLFPLIGFGLRFLFPSVLPESLWSGVIFLCLLPSTVQSSIAFTSMAKGNVPSAFAAASASQMIGVFYTPILAAMVFSGGALEVSSSSLMTVLLVVFVPFLCGHLLRPYIAIWVSKNKYAIGLSDRGAILLAVYSAFSMATNNELWSQIPPKTMGVLFIICLTIFLLVLSATYFVGRALKLNREDRIVLLFCGTKKSLIQGIPMARILFLGPDLGLILLPVMVFHQLQLMLCAYIAGTFQRRQSNV